MKLNEGLPLVQEYINLLLDKQYNAKYTMTKMILIDRDGEQRFVATGSLRERFESAIKFLKDEA